MFRSSCRPQATHNLLRQFCAILIIFLLTGSGLPRPSFALVAPPSALLAPGGSISLTTLGATVTEPFNSLAQSGTANPVTDLPTSWEFVETGANANTTYAAGTGSSNAGNTYSFGSAAVPGDRALGQVDSNDLSTTFGASYTNNTGATINTLDIAYTGEQWRSDSGSSTPDRLDFQYSTTATGLTTGTYTDVNQLDFTGPQPSAATGLLDGNAAANKTAISHTITGLNIPDGATFWIRWVSVNIGGSDDGLAVDDFSLTPKFVVTPTLSVNDVSLAEGNSGTRTFTFNVSLSAPALSGGVSFDIATADDTATVAGNDYVANSLTGQVIPEGSSSYTFDVTVNGDATDEPNETFFVNVSNITGANGGDTQGQGTIVNDDATLTPICAIQGSGSTSPLEGQTVTTAGVVTGLRANGFFVQQAECDADTETSDGIFVFTSSAPPAGATIGNLVHVTGTVAEFVPSSSPYQRPLTELVGPISVNVISTGNSLPAPVLLTAAETTGASETGNPLETLEEYEGMRVEVASLTVVAPTQGSMNEANATATSNGVFFGVVTGVARPFREPGINISSPLPAGAPGGVPRFDENPERLRVDSDAQTGAAALNVASGTVITNLTGVLDYAFFTWTILPDATSPHSVASTPPAPAPLPAPSAEEFTVASFNMQRIFDTTDDPATGDPVLTAAAYDRRLTKASRVIRDILNLPDVIGVQEVENLQTLQDIAARVNTDVENDTGGSPQYTAYLFEGNDVGGIDVGFLVKESRITVIEMTQEGKTATYINPNNGAPETLNDRPPLVLQAMIQRPDVGPVLFTVIVNHLRSLSGIDDETPDGAGTEGARVRAKRRAQAEFLAQLIQARQEANPTERIIVVGDMNAFQFNDGYVDVVGTIMGTPAPENEVVLASADLVNPDLTNLVDTLPPAARYSYIFDGNAQVLDHIMVNDDALLINNRFAYARVNADQPLVDFGDGAIPDRSSDHDIPVAYFTLDTPQPIGTVIISEFRLRGPGPSSDSEVTALRDGGDRTQQATINEHCGCPFAPNDEFIEIHNNTDTDILVRATDGSEGWALVGSDGVTRFVIPNGTTIPARGYFLGANRNGYSLISYGTSPRNGLPDISPEEADWINIPDDGGIALFRTANPANFTMTHRLDAAGYEGVDPLYREGNGLPLGGVEFNDPAPQFSYYRDLRSGLHRDTGDNAADFIGVNTAGAGMRLGAPGPQNLFSPTQRNREFIVTLLDGNVSTASSPNRNREPNGRFTIRRRITNNTNQHITQLVFRIVDITTLNSPTHAPGLEQADLRAISSEGGTVITSDANVCASYGLAAPCPVNVRGAVLEEPPDQPNGGGWNSSLVIEFDGSLAPEQTVEVEWAFTIQQPGYFRFFINLEPLLLRDSGEEENPPEVEADAQNIRNFLRRRK